jgi:ATP/maltotriose-dependent transcriptional regulator MalT
VTRTPVTTKLRAPKTRTNLVARPRLREALGWKEGRKLTLVSAPAGFGKTTLLAECTEDWSAQGRSVAWVSLDESDSDPSRFLSYLVGALQTAEGGIGEGVLTVLLGVHFVLLDRDRHRLFVKFKSPGARYCVRGGVRVVSIASSNSPNAIVHL